MNDKLNEYRVENTSIAWVWRHLRTDYFQQASVFCTDHGCDCCCHTMSQPSNSFGLCGRPDVTSDGFDSHARHQGVPAQE